LLGGFVYFMYVHHYVVELDWMTLVVSGFTLVVVIGLLGAVFGYWSSQRNLSRLERLQEAMQLLEKGILTQPAPPLGEDEIGRLGEQLNRIARLWEEQVGSLQRLSNNNAQLARKAKYSAIVEERQRLARELHDAVSQQLFAISMTATAVGRTLDKDFEKARRQIHLIEEMSSVAQSEMRALLLHLRPVHLEGKLLSEGLIELLQELQAKVPMSIVWDLDPDIRLPSGIEDHLFRIVQEALSNALRHSQASKLEVRLQRLGEVIRLSLRDNGVGFAVDDKKQTSYGMSTMRERVNEIGGSLSIITAPGQGTRLEIRVPIMIEDQLDEGSDGIDGTE
jgi:NarL family two-component system sensor histidine kinase LiaS